MATKAKKESAAVVALREENAILNRNLDAANTRWIEEAQKNGKHIGDGMKIQKLERQVEVLTLIADGKQLEAMQRVLRTDVMLFNTQIVIADDQSRIAWEDESLERMKKMLVESVNAAKFERKEMSTTVGPMGDRGEG